MKKKIATYLFVYLSLGVNLFAQGTWSVSTLNGETYACLGKDITFVCANSSTSFSAGCFNYTWEIEGLDENIHYLITRTSNRAIINFRNVGDNNFIVKCTPARNQAICENQPNALVSQREIQLGVGRNLVPSDITNPFVTCGFTQPITFSVKEYFPSSVVSYTWTLPPGWTASSLNQRVIAVTPSGNSSGTISATVTFSEDYYDKMNCIARFDPPLIRSTSRVLSMNQPFLNSVIGTNTLGWGDRSVLTYITTSLTNANYSWTIPCGWTSIDGLTGTVITSTNSIQVIPSGYTGGVVSVFANLLCDGVSRNTNTVTISTSIGSGTPTVSGPDLVCTSGSFMLNSSPDPVSWSVSPSIVSPSSGSGSNAVFSRVSNGPATITYTFNYCGVFQSWSKNFHVGPYSSSNYPISGPANASCNSYVYYNIPQLTGVTSINWTWPSGWTYVSGQGTQYLALRTGRYSGTVGVGVNNTCGSSGSYATRFTSVSGYCGYSLITSPNPASSQLELTLTKPDQELANSSELELSARNVEQPESQIVLYNLKQEAVFRGSSKSMKTTIPLTGIPKGVYVLKVAIADQVLEKQILIEK